MAKLKIRILIGAKSDEYVSCLTIGEYVFGMLNREKYDVSTLRVSKDGEQWMFPTVNDSILPKDLDEAASDSYASLTLGQAIDRLKAEKPDVIFLASPGGTGEDGSFQGLMQAAGLAYTSSGVMASSLAMDKYRTGQMYEMAGLKTPKTRLFKRRDWKKDPKAVEKEILETLGIPCFVKPSTNGSSIGAGPVKAQAELEKRLKDAFDLNAQVVVQELIKGREMTCAVLDDGENNPIVFTPTEIVLLGGEFYTFEDKHVLEHGMDEINPPELPEETIKALQQVSLTAHKALGCVGLSRTDMFYTDKGEIYALETNTIPGMTAASVYCKIVDKFNLTMEQFVDKIIRSALTREA